MRIIFFLFAWIVTCNLLAQEPSPELLKLSKSPVDSIRFEALRDLGYSFEFSDSSKAMYFYRQAMNLAREKNHPLWICKSYSDFGNVQSNAANFGSAEDYHRLSLQYAVQAGNKRRIASALNNIANTFGNRKILDSAIAYDIRSIQILEKEPNPDLLLVVYSNVASYFNEIANYREALNYALKANELAKQIPDTIEMVMSGNQAIRSYFHLGDTTAYLRMIKVTEPLIPTIDDDYIKAVAYQNIGAFYMYISDLQAALPALDSALLLSYHIPNPQLRVSTMVAKGDWFIKAGKLEDGERLLDEALSEAKLIRELAMLREIYSLKSFIAEKRGDYRNAYDFLQQVVLYKDTLYSNNVALATSEMQEKFEAEKKQFRIDELNNQQALTEARNYKQRIWIILLLSLCVATIVGAILYYLNQRKSKIIDKQNLLIKENRIQELEKERQIIALGGLIKGEEQERTRLAKDLHDGLGGMLTGIKLSMSSMKNNFILSESSMRLFNLTLNQMDLAINEMRRVAHNMMPESLIAFGLSKAIEQMCVSLSENGIHIIFESIGMDERLQKDKEINAYRIVQELVNNAMKHAKAKEIIVQISRNDDMIQLIVEDDGAGMTNQREGAGYANLRNRVNYLRGTMDINSQPDQGTSILISFPFQ